ncbi:hypothetical protein EXQ37_03390 [Clostridium botulinum]|nr:hypothetical protein [Clostridium botulinum]MBO0558890.1 hypothetical protein [Clostridium botulinum]MBO0565838.1 hypothetical protein [Clostridium botulinum]
MKRGWGYGKNRATDAELFNSNKILIDENELRIIYKTHGFLNNQEIILHDRRKSNNKSLAILKDIWGHKKCLNVTGHFNSFKEVFEYIEENYKNNFLWD